MNRFRKSLLLFLAIGFLITGLSVPQVIFAKSVSDLYRKEPQRKYEGAVSFFFVHGYVTSFYQDFQEDFHTLEVNNTKLTGRKPGLIGRPGNVTMANAGGNGSFHHDVGLIIGAELNSQLKLLTEQHWINRNNPKSDDSGSPFKKIATTQAKIRWKPSGDLPFRVTMGRFWTAFGGYAQDELLSAQNRFTQVPMARYASPYAFNEGIQFDGANKFGDLGLNYTLEINNGNSAFDKPAHGTFDNNHSSDALARIGFVPFGFIPRAHKAEIGLSYADGTLRRGDGDFNNNDTNPINVNADWTGQALDFRYHTPSTEFKAYWISSDEELLSGPTLERNGYFAEVTYELVEGLPVLGTMAGKIRYDKFEREALSVSSAENGNTLNDAKTYEDRKISYGLEFHPQDQLRLGLEYHTSEEMGAYPDSLDVEDNGFTLSATASF